MNDSYKEILVKRQTPVGTERRTDRTDRFKSGGRTSDVAAVDRWCDSDRSGLLCGTKV